MGRGERTRKTDGRGWFWAGVAEKLTPSALILVIVTLGYQVYARDLSDTVSKAVAQSAEMVKAVAESVGGALGMFNNTQQEMRDLLVRINAQHEADRRRLDRLEAIKDRASIDPTAAAAGSHP
jgi:hypothetical protein